jgi:integrase
MHKHTVEKMIEEFHDALIEERTTRNTRRAYLSRVTGFLKYAELTGSLQNICEDQETLKQTLHSYRSFLRDDNALSASTLNATWTALQKFFASFDTNFFRPEKDAENPVFRQTLSADEQLLLLQRIDRFPVKPRAVVLCFLLGGLRLGECAQLDVEDISLETRTMAIDRRSRTRILPMDAYVVHVLEEWLSERDNYGKQSSDALFINRRGERITCSGLDRIVRTSGHRAGFVLSARMLRETWIQRLLISSNLREAAKITGIKKHRLVSRVTAELSPAFDKNAYADSTEYNTINTTTRAI